MEEKIKSESVVPILVIERLPKNGDSWIITDYFRSYDNPFILKAIRKFILPQVESKYPDNKFRIRSGFITFT